MRKQTGGPDNNFVEGFGIILSDNSLVGPTNPVPTSPATGVGASRISQLDYVGGANPIYIGTAISGSATSAAAWQIRKLTYDGSNNVTAIQYAAAGSLTQIWDNRASLTYS